MKRLLSVVVALGLTLPLAACGGSGAKASAFEAPPAQSVQSFSLSGRETGSPAALAEILLSQTGKVTPSQADAARTQNVAAPQDTRAGLNDATVYQGDPQAAPTFSDVSPSDWFYPYVTELAELGGVSGYADGTFGPMNTISRAEVSAMAMRMFPSTPSGDQAGTAARVAQANGNYWANDVITHAVLNLVIGFGESAAEWSRPATREEISYLMYRVYDAWCQEQGKSSLPSYSEARALIGDYAEAVALSDYEPCILWLYTYGIVQGVNAEGDYNPKATTSRAECCTLIVSLYHPENWKQTDWNAVIESLQQPPSQLPNGTDFTGASRLHYEEDVAYYYCRALEEEIGIQIFYLPEWTPKAAGLLQPSDLNSFPIDGAYFSLVLDELRKMKDAYDLYPEGFLQEVVQRKGNRKTEIILCPYTYEGVSSFGLHVYDESGDATKVDQIYYSGCGDSQYYSHEMGHMVMSSAAILNGWNDTCQTWEGLSTSGMSYVSLYAMSSRPEDWAETWAYLWHQTDAVKAQCGDSGMLAKVRYLTQLLDQYNTVDVSQLPWASLLQ